MRNEPCYRQSSLPRACRKINYWQSKRRFAYVTSSRDFIGVGVMKTPDAISQTGLPWLDNSGQKMFWEAARGHLQINNLI
jgi:hypothetical protein